MTSQLEKVKVDWPAAIDQAFRVGVVEEKERIIDLFKNSKVMIWIFDEIHSDEDFDIDSLIHYLVGLVESNEKELEEWSTFAKEENK